MINHHNIILPQFIKPFLVSKFTYDSHIERSFSGKEFIKNGKILPESYFTIKSARVTKDELDNIVNFFRLRQGSLYSFLLEDFDNFIENQIIAIADGIQQEFKIIKTYKDDIAQMEIPINFPDQESIKIFKDDVAVDVAFSAEEYKIIFASPPEKDSKISVSCRFYKRVRLISKNIEYIVQRDGSYLVSDIDLREVI
jgi:uncharacterized protein (TIGR02217 family)